MGLRDYVVPTKEIPLPGGGSFTVRGLGFNHLSTLVIDHGARLMLVFNAIYTKAQEKNLTGSDVAGFIQEALTKSPELVADIIVLASDEPVDEKTRSAARSLPPVTQMEAMTEIVALTFVSEAEVKKLVEIVTKAMEQTGGLMTVLNQPSTGGSGTSAGA